MLSGLYRLLQNGAGTFNLNFGISVPAGSIDERDATPMGPDQSLHQDLDGPQLETDWVLTLGWEWLM